MKKLARIILLVILGIGVFIFGTTYIISLLMGEHPNQSKWDAFDNRFEKYYNIVSNNKDASSVSIALDSLEVFIKENDTIGLFDWDKNKFIEVDSLLKNRVSFEAQLKVDRRVNNSFYIDGSSLYVVEAVKKRLNDPDSFEHVETRHYTNEDMDYLAIDMTFRAKNAFGGTITKVATCQLFDDNSVKNLQIRD
jgi:hypothetical protein